MFLEFTISALLNIQHQVSSICPENATISSISAMPVETFLCNVRVNINHEITRRRWPTSGVLAMADRRKRENTK
jgi:hypothetical protein